MKTMSRSPERFTFGEERYKEKLIENPNDENAQAMVDFYQKMRDSDFQNENNDNWKKHNLEYDLRTCDWIIDKVCDSDAYAKDLYSALCNNEFQKLEVIPILKNETWSCSWRYAGGIIAHMCKAGDYIDWYCAGGEGSVTDQIRQDLKALGWIVINEINLE
jgi:hypothetical protein